MIGIRYNTEWVEMPGAYSINMVIANSMFDFESTEGEYSYQFSIPLSNFNKKLFGFPDIIENSLPMGKEYEVELWLGKEFWKYATMVTGKVGTTLSGKQKNLEVTLKSGAGEFITKLGKKLLKEIDYGNDERIPEAYRYFLTLIVATPDLQTSDQMNIDIWDGVGGHTHYNYTQNCTSPVFSDNVKALCDQINSDSAAHKFTASYRAYDQDLTNGNQRCWLYIRESVFMDADAGTVFTWSYINFPDPVHLSDNATPIDNIGLSYYDSEYVIIAHMNNVLLWPLYQKHFDNQGYCFPLMYNKAFSDGSTTAFATLPTEILINSYVGGTYEISYVLKSIPFPYLKYVFERIAAHMGYSLTGDFFSDAELATLILENMTVADQWDDAGFYDKINIAEHVEGLSCIDLMMSVKAMFGALYKFDARLKRCEITNLKSVLARKDYDNWTAKAAPATEIIPNDYDGITFSFTMDGGDAELSNAKPDITKLTLCEAVDTLADLPAAGNNYGDLRLVIDCNFWHVWVDKLFPTADAWVGLGEFMNDLKVGNGSMSITSRISPASIFKDQYITVDGSHTGTMPNTMPVAAQPGSEIAINYFNEVVPKLLFYRGIQKDGNNVDYPMASMDVYNYAGTKIANYAIKWDGLYGLVAMFLQDFINFMKGAKSVTFPMFLNKSDLINLDLFKKKFIDRNLYFLERLELNFTEKGMGDQLGYYKLYRPLADGVSYTDYETRTPAPCVTLDWVNMPVFENETGETIDITLEAVGCCEGDFTFSVYSGTLPPGISLVDGHFVGTFEAPCGEYTFTIKLMDECGNIKYYPKVWNVVCCEILDWTNEAIITNLNTMTAVNWLLTAEGCCDGAFIFSISSGTLPPDLSLAANTISGTTTDVGGTYTFTVKLVDECGNERLYVKTIIVS